MLHAACSAMSAHEPQEIISIRSDLICSSALPFPFSKPLFQLGLRGHSPHERSTVRTNWDFWQVTLDGGRNILASSSPFIYCKFVSISHQYQSDRDHTTNYVVDIVRFNLCSFLLLFFQKKKSCLLSWLRLECSEIMDSPNSIDNSTFLESVV